jgi:prepilin-type N-terminal cleavage/methylation domain-containing protein
LQTRTLRAFTLIELLITLAIITILAALLFPVFAAARASARKAACLSNFRQIGTAMLLYSGDWDEKFARTQTSDTPGTPGYISWWSTSYYQSALEVYIRSERGGVDANGRVNGRSSVWWDPSDPDRTDPAMWGSIRNNGLITGVNRSLAELSAPSRTVFMTLHTERWRDYECATGSAASCEPSVLPVNNGGDPFWYSDYFDICLNPWSRDSNPTDAFYWAKGFAAPPCDPYPADGNCILEYMSIDGRYWNAPPEHPRYTGGHPFAFMDGHVKVVPFSATYRSAVDNMWAVNQDEKPAGY